MSKPIEYVRNIAEVKTETFLEPDLYKVTKELWACKCCNGYIAINDYNITKSKYQNEVEKYLVLLETRKLRSLVRIAIL